MFDMPSKTFSENAAMKKKLIYYISKFS